MSKKISTKDTKATKKLFPKTIYVENYGTRKHPNVSATHDLETMLFDYTATGTKPTILARYELVEVGTVETTTKFKVSE